MKVGELIAALQNGRDFFGNLDVIAYDEKSNKYFNTTWVLCESEETEKHIRAQKKMIVYLSEKGPCERACPNCKECRK